jgi:hypothetical protein
MEKAMERKKINLNEDIWQTLQDARTKKRLGWNEFILWMLKNTKELQLPNQIHRALESRKKSERYQDFLDGGLTAAVFFLRPEAIKLLKEMTQDWSEADRKIEELIARASGQPTEIVLDPPEKERLSESVSVNSAESVLQKTLHVGKKAVVFQMAPEGDPDQSRWSAPQRRWFKRREIWLAEAERWKWKNSIKLIWPEGALARVLSEEETILGSHIRRIRAYFVYDLLRREDFDFLEPYRLDFKIEARVSPGTPDRIDDTALLFQGFSFRTHRAMLNMLKRKKEIFEEMEKKRPGNYNHH